MTVRPKATIHTLHVTDLIRFLPLNPATFSFAGIPLIIKYPRLIPECQGDILLLMPGGSEYHPNGEASKA
jgi:hypothetical protein